MSGLPSRVPRATAEQRGRRGGADGRPEGHRQGIGAGVARRTEPPKNAVPLPACAFLKARVLTQRALRLQAPPGQGLRPQTGSES